LARFCRVANHKRRAALARSWEKSNILTASLVQRQEGRHISQDASSTPYQARERAEGKFCSRQIASQKLTTLRPQRAQELIAVNQKQSALTILHEHVTSKRTRNSTIASLEPVVLLFVELCVELRKGKAAKDGLYNYKNTSQNTNVATIEVHFLNLAAQFAPPLTHA
jgi:hypothetical protein